MSLITTIQQFRQYVTGITFTSNQTQSLPNMAVADERYIIPVTGKSIYDSINTSENIEDGNLNRLKELCMRAVAPLALMDMLSRKQVQISDIGLHSAVTDKLAPASRWAYLELKESLLNDGCAALEDLWKFLYDNASQLVWESPAQKTLFSNGIEFSRYFNLMQPHRLFFLLLPVIAECEDGFIIDNVGNDFYTSIRDTQNPEGKVKQLLVLWKKAIANLTISKACIKLAVKVTDRGFTVLMGDGGDYPSKSMQDSSYQMKQALIASAESDGNIYITKAMKLLNDNPDEAAFADYFNSEYYTAPTEQAGEGINTNRHRKQFYL